VTKTISIYFDGGCSPNPGQAYGSFHILNGDQELFYRSRVSFGFGTNNFAEFAALTMALKTLDDDMAEHDADQKEYNLFIESDSKIVVNRLTKKNKIHKKPRLVEASTRMYNLACGCLDYMKRFKSVQVVWKKRDANVERFGH
jgi:ribonuclease HI